MKKPIRQEVEVFRTIPFLRKEIAKELTKTYKQKKVAEIMGMTEGAVSQYINGKRGVFNIPAELLQKAQKFVKDNAKTIEPEHLNSQIENWLKEKQLTDITEHYMMNKRGRGWK